MKFLFLIPSAIFFSVLALTEANAAFSIQRPDRWQSSLQVVSADSSLGWTRVSSAELTLNFDPSQAYAVLKIQASTPCQPHEMCIQVLPKPTIKIMPMGQATTLKCGVKMWTARSAQISVPEYREVLEVYDYSGYTCGNVPEDTLVARFVRVDQIQGVEQNAYFKGTTLSNLQ